MDSLFVSFPIVPLRPPFIMEALVISAVSGDVLVMTVVSAFCGIKKMTWALIQYKDVILPVHV